jgi:hypothetical protein
VSERQLPAASREGALRVGQVVGTEGSYSASARNAASSAFTPSVRSGSKPTQGGSLPTKGRA